MSSVLAAIMRIKEADIVEDMDQLGICWYQIPRFAGLPRRTTTSNDYQQVPET